MPLPFLRQDSASRAGYFLAVVAFIIASPQRVSAKPADELKFTSESESRAEFARAVTPFFAEHCASCHNDKKFSGDLDLAELDPDMETSTSGARWAMVVKRLKEGDMPPKERPRPDAGDVKAVIDWANAEAKRAGKHFTTRELLSNGNEVPHRLLFDPDNIPPFDGGPRVRQLSPEIYDDFKGEVAKGTPGLGQPFSPAGKGAFKDKGSPTIDEPFRPPSTTSLARSAAHWAGPWPPPCSSPSTPRISQLDSPTPASQPQPNKPPRTASHKPWRSQATSAATEPN